MFFLILGTHSNQDLYIYYLFIVSGTLTESMRCHEKREGPYYGIYLFEINRHIFFLLIISKVLKKFYSFDPQLYEILHLMNSCSLH